METTEEQLIGLSPQKLRLELERLKKLAENNYTIRALGNSSLAISREFEEIDWTTN